MGDEVKYRLTYHLMGSDELHSLYAFSTADYREALTLLRMSLTYDLDYVVNETTGEVVAL